MRLQMFSVYDKQVQAYLPVFFARTIGEAIRSFTEAVNDPAKPFGKYATDYALHSFGEFDDNSGSFLVHDPVRVISANEVLNVDDVFVPERKVS
ncbi:MAG: nonstructural protein [Microvirus sp.]|nr:MAG: nonstructural protein [Microvirus sp.]